MVSTTPVTPEGVGLAVAGLVGLFALVWASGVVVDRSLRIAQHFDVPDVLIGVFVVSIGTSLPEIGTHITASAGILGGSLDYAVASDTVLGGSMGSSAVQQFFLVGLLLVGFGRYVVDETLLRWSYAPMLGSFLLLFGLGVDGTISRLDSVVLLLAFAAYASVSFRGTRQRRVLERIPDESSQVERDVLVALGGFVAVLASAYVVLAVIEVGVARLRLGGSMVGVMTIGLASALPELSTVLESVRRRTPTLALGTLLGSNVVNTLVGVGLGGLLSTYAVPESVLFWDLPFKFGAGLLLLGYAMTVGNGTLGRREGVALVGAYFLYVVGRLLLYP
jgi:cation:H+ antiporter